MPTQNLGRNKKGQDRRNEGEEEKEERRRRCARKRSIQHLNYEREGRGNETKISNKIKNQWTELWKEIIYKKTEK